MTDIESTWHRRELPLLRTVALMEQRGEQFPNSENIVAEAGLDANDGAVGLRALHDAAYITGRQPRTTRFALLMVRLTEKGRRAVGLWPSEDPYDKLLAWIDHRIDVAADEAERSRLQRFRGAVLDVGRNLLATAIYEAMAGR